VAFDDRLVDAASKEGFPIAGHLPGQP
jgi:hypothetical protein